MVDTFWVCVCVWCSCIFDRFFFGCFFVVLRKLTANFRSTTISCNRDAITLRANGRTLGALSKWNVGQIYHFGLITYALRNSFSIWIFSLCTRIALHMLSLQPCCCVITWNISIWLEKEEEEKKSKHVLIIIVKIQRNAMALVYFPLVAEWIRFLVLMCAAVGVVVVVGVFFFIHFNSFLEMHLCTLFLNKLLNEKKAFLHVYRFVGNYGDSNSVCVSASAHTYDEWTRSQCGAALLGNGLEIGGLSPLFLDHSFGCCIILAGPNAFVCFFSLFKNDKKRVYIMFNDFKHNKNAVIFFLLFFEFVYFLSHFIFSEPLFHSLFL